MEKICHSINGKLEMELMIHRNVKTNRREGYQHSYRYGIKMNRFGNHTYYVICLDAPFGTYY